MKKGFLKSISVILCFILTLATVFTFSVAATEGETTPTPISTKEELNNIRNDRAGNYYLTCDIVFTPEDFAEGGAFYNDGKGFIPLSTNGRPFTGTFDGNGYKISGLEISVSGLVYTISTTSISSSSSSSSSGSGTDDGWTGDYPIPPSVEIPTVSPVVGLFGGNTGTIKNLYLVDSTISGNSTNGAKMYIGGIVGHNKGTVSNCAVSATLSGNTAAYVGGIVGYQSAGSIENCVSLANITSGGKYAGIAGAVAAGSLNTSYSAGLNKAAVADYNTSLDLNAYYVADEDYSGFGTRVATADAANTASFEGFDFDYTWCISNDINMPWLTIIKDALPGDANGDGTVNIDDVVVIAQYVAGWNIEIDLSVSNVNHDTVVNIDDVVYLAQYVAGWESAVLY